MDLKFEQAIGSGDTVEVGYLALDPLKEKLVIHSASWLL
jgi:hypothetical protein